MGFGHHGGGYGTDFYADAAREVEGEHGNWPLHVFCTLRSLRSATDARAYAQGWCYRGPAEFWPLLGQGADPAGCRHPQWPSSHGHDLDRGI